MSTVPRHRVERQDLRVRGVQCENGLAGISVVAVVIAAPLPAASSRNQLFGVQVFDPATLATVEAVLLVSAVVASFLPATHAAESVPSAPSAKADAHST